MVEWLRFAGNHWFDLAQLRANELHDACQIESPRLERESYQVRHRTVAFLPVASCISASTHRDFLIFHPKLQFAYIVITIPFASPTSAVASCCCVSAGVHNIESVLLGIYCG
jgi:hypothetical protein